MNFTLEGSKLSFQVYVRRCNMIPRVGRLRPSFGEMKEEMRRGPKGVALLSKRHLEKELHTLTHLSTFDTDSFVILLLNSIFHGLFSRV